MPTDQNPKQLVAQRLKDANNILVTVGRNPGVDDLSAALALTLLLDKIGKTPTAVFSGKIPPAIEFLEPGKTFDTNVDGLRDFIIALDKEKADRLRYKVEDDVVRVFITPYKTTITEKDLTFSQGDFNVDLIVAFGVEKREDLDTAITAHGRILHDAAVITIDQFPGGSSLGEIDWNDTEASSLCEMLMSLTESLQSGAIDQPIATAILTGLVASTDRFRNEKTSPKVMTMAAQLMAAGANQQLIAEKLEEATTVNTGKLNAQSDESNKTPEAVEEPKKSNDGEMKVEHGVASQVDNTASEEPADAADLKAEEVADEHSAEAVEEAQEELKEITDTQLPAVQAEPKTETGDAKASSWRDRPTPEPSMGGTLNATTEEAEEANRNAEEDKKNHVILSHDEPMLGEANSGTSVLNAMSLPPTEPSVNDIFTEFPMSDNQPKAVTPPPVVSKDEPVLKFEETPIAPVAQPVTQPNPTLADLEEQVRQQEASAAPAPAPSPEVDPLEHARAAVDAALGAQPFNPAGQPLAATGAQPLGSIDRSTPELAPELFQPPVEAPAPEPFAASPAVEQPAPSVPGLPPLPPLPDFSTLPPLPGDVPAPSASSPAMPSFGLPEEPQPTTPPPLGVQPSSDPSQFKLPGAP